MNAKKSRLIREVLSTDEGIQTVAEQASSVILDPVMRAARKDSIVALLEIIRELDSTRMSHRGGF